MCALSSVARLSVSMTMSMSSGLFSMFDDDQFTEKAALDKNFNSAAANMMALPDGGFSPKWTRRKSDGNLYFSPKAIRRKGANADKASNAIGNSTGSKVKGDGPSPKVKKKKKDHHTKEPSPVSSPVNSSGVKIVIHQGSDSESSTAACDEENASEGANESFLSVEAANAFSEDKKIANMSQVFLLSEIR